MKLTNIQVRFLAAAIGAEVNLGEPAGVSSYERNLYLVLRDLRRLGLVEGVMYPGRYSYVVHFVATDAGREWWADSGLTVSVDDTTDLATPAARWWLDRADGGQP